VICGFSGKPVNTISTRANSSRTGWCCKQPFTSFSSYQSKQIFPTLEGFNLRGSEKPMYKKVRSVRAACFQKFGNNLNR